MNMVFTIAEPVRNQAVGLKVEHFLGHLEYQLQKRGKGSQRIFTNGSLKTTFRGKLKAFKYTVSESLDI
jgi:hypothetical protein